MKRLINQIDNRNVIILCHGPSLQILEKKRMPDNVCYASLNNWIPAENNILRPQGLLIEILWIAAKRRIEQLSDEIYNYALRNSGYTSHIFLTRPSSLGFFHKKMGSGHVREIIEKTIVYHCEPGAKGGVSIDNVDIEIVDLFDPVRWEVLSLGALVLALLQADVKKIAIFGADGKSQNGQVYYRQETYQETVTPELNGHKINIDTKNLNSGWKTLLTNAGMPSDYTNRIRNCSEDSDLECWKTISIDEGLEWIKTKK